MLTNGQQLGYAVSQLQLYTSERLFTGGGPADPSSSMHLGNWSLKIDGVDRSSWIESVGPSGYNGASTLNVTLKSPLYTGRLELTLRDAVRDESGKQLDGDTNGIAGGSYVFTLDVNAPKPLSASQVRGSADTPAVAALKGGGYVLIRDEGNLLARVYDVNGNPTGGSADIAVNVASVLYPGFSERKGYAVAPLNDGGFVVIWPGYTYDAASNNYDQDVWARRFSAAGAPVGDEFRVHDPSPLRDEENPAIAATSDGGFTVAWRVQRQQRHRVGHLRPPV